MTATVGRRWWSAGGGAVAGDKALLVAFDDPDVNDWPARAQRSRSGRSPSGRGGPACHGLGRFASRSARLCDPLEVSRGMTIPFRPAPRSASGSTSGEKADMARRGRRCSRWSRRGGVVLRGKIGNIGGSLSSPSTSEPADGRGRRDSQGILVFPFRTCPAPGPPGSSRPPGRPPAPPPGAPFRGSPAPERPGWSCPGDLDDVAEADYEEALEIAS